VTPKGAYLDNHFGAEIDASPYGPQPTLVSKDGKIEILLNGVIK
jgi:hypothetical protein